MVQLANVCFSSNEDLSWILRTHDIIKNFSIAAHTNHSTAGAETETSISGACCLVNLAKSVSSRYPDWSLKLISGLHPCA